MAEIPRVRRKKRAVKPASAVKSIFLLSCLVLGLFLLIWKGMSWLAYDDLSGAELYQQSMDGRRDVRRMAAVEWARKLAIEAQSAERKGGDDSGIGELQMTELTPRLEQQQKICQVLELSSTGASPMSGDDYYRSALVNVLGFSYIKPAAASCLWNLLETQSSLRVPILVSLSRLRQPIPLQRRKLLENLLKDSDLSSRKIGAYIVGVLADSSSDREYFGPTLLAFLQDSNEGVRWNAAFALASWGRQEGESVFDQIFSYANSVGSDGHILRAEVDGASSSAVLTEDRLNAIREAFRIVAKMNWEKYLQKLAVISQEHSHLKIRLAAKDALSQQR